MNPEPFLAADPSIALASAMTAFRHFCAGRQREVPLTDYAGLYEWSVRDWREFWECFLEWTALRWSGSANVVCDGNDVETARFFPNVRLNYVENLVGPSEGDDQPALSAYDEGGLRVRLTRRELRARVLAFAAGLARLGVREGDRVVAIARNDELAVVACLGAASLGAIWSSVSPDLGVEAILSRFGQLSPVVLLAHGSQTMQGIRRDLQDRVRGVAEALPDLRAIVALDDGLDALDLPVPLYHAHEFGTVPPAPELPWPHFNFNHPLFILFSSGTTGPPKCIVHGAGGTLLEHAKEHRLHCDLRPGDRLYFHTTCGWMMWNWQLTALASGIEIVLFDGSVSYPERDSLFRLIDSASVTHFGTSPAYLQLCRDIELSPAELFTLSSLRAIMSTGSVLPDSLYDWAAQHIKPVPLQSISGGTDIIGCFVLGNPTLPVFRGESQCISLGLDVQVALDDGYSRVGTGELVCCSPFPSCPVGFLGDDSRRRFHDAYFTQHEGVWTHGDVVELTARGTARVLGRWDGVLNVRGVRIGPAEICQIVLEHAGVRQAMAVEQRDPREPGGSRIVLLVVMRPGMSLDRALTLQFKRDIKVRASANHVPGVIADVSALPTTFSGKLSERAARDALNGDSVANRSAIRNPDVLSEIAGHPAVQVAK